MIRQIAEEPSFALEAKEKYIDSRNWMWYLSSFRRKLVKEPLVALGNNQRLFLDLCKDFEAASDSAIDAEEKKEPISALNGSRIDDSAEPSEQQPSTSAAHPTVAQEGMKRLFSFMIVDAQKELATAISAYSTLCSTSDLRIPQEWYPFARLMKRKIIYHGGPTNSGKTYHALQRLRQADVNAGGGLYCGPLRLLALEVYEQLNRQGVYTDLLTGQEQRQVPFATHISCTLEMVNISKEYDVAVVDEIQMIADEQRGYAWTRALQGLRAREIHVCGGLEASQLVQKLVESTGDDFELKKYERLSTLKINETSLQGDYSKIMPGDCIVAFSRADIFSIRREVERLTPYKCAVIYGQLPPETRSMQARLFNEENTGYDVLVASDAIGMGLNLNIRRIVFHTTLKRGAGGSGSAYWVNPSSVKQIAGRAGRLSSKYKFGEVTAWQEADLAYIRAVMEWDIPQIPTAGIFPSVEQVEIFSEQLKKSAAEEKDVAAAAAAAATAASATVSSESTDGNVNFSEEIEPLIEKKEDSSEVKLQSSLVVDLQQQQQQKSISSVVESQMRLSTLMGRFVELAQMDGRYFLCDHDEMITVANWLHSIPLSIADRFVFSNAPVNTRDAQSMTMFYQFAATYAQCRPVALNVRLSHSRPRDVLEFADLCAQHSSLGLYLWLAFRFPKYFVERDICLQQKEYAVSIIERSLESNLLQQKYSHSNDYKKIRQYLNDSDGLPPLSFGSVRALTKEYLNKIDGAKLKGLFPRSAEEVDAGAGDSFAYSRNGNGGYGRNKSNGGSSYKQTTRSKVSSSNNRR